MKFNEHLKRSIAKAITFRILILCSDSIIVYAITHRVDYAAGMVIFTNAASTVWYFMHERAWNEIHWGKEPHKPKRPLRSKKSKK